MADPAPLQPGDPCPLCGDEQGIIVVKRGKRGPFLGCTRYRIAGCKFTQTYRPPVAPGSDARSLIAEIRDKLDKLEGLVPLPDSGKDEQR